MVNGLRQKNLKTTNLTSQRNRPLYPNLLSQHFYLDHEKTPPPPFHIGADPQGSEPKWPDEELLRLGGMERDRG